MKKSKLKINIGGFKSGTEGVVEKSTQLVYSNDCTKLIATKYKFYPNMGYFWLGVNEPEFEILYKSE